MDTPTLNEPAESAEVRVRMSREELDEVLAASLAPYLEIASRTLDRVRAIERALPALISERI